MPTNSKTAAVTRAFSIGQTVRMKLPLGIGTSETYKITRKLPMEGIIPKYRMKSFSEQYERVIAEDLIEIIDSSPSDLDDRLAQHTFRDMITIKTSKGAKNRRFPWVRK